MSYQFTPTQCPTKEVAEVEFGILSPEEIKAYSVVKIEHVEIYENKEPKVGGLADVRMGCIDRNMECYTCGETMNNCPGHFGHIELNMPVYHVEFLKVVKKILECVCHKCARYRLLPTDHRYKKLLHVKEKFKYAHEMAKNKLVCEYPDCESQLLPLRRHGITLYFDPKKVDRKMAKIPLSAAEARRILQKISDDTCWLIGLNPVHARPEWMITTVLPVPPPCVRPSIFMDNANRSEDDLTHKLTDIVKYNNLVKRHENTRSVGEFKVQLENHVTNYINNDVKAVPTSYQKGGRPVKSITARMKGKEGLIRGNLMGKRVNFSARTVITGDPNISMEEVGVPRSIARTLTFPEVVTPYNIEHLQKLVNNSPDYPGAKFVIKEDDSRVNLQLAMKKPILRIGDKVERHMKDGDWVIFNRQPTLHKMSMMGHRVRVMPFSTFRLNVNVCASYNADFDGDEMNLHMPQSYATVAEIQTLSKVSTLLVSPQANKPVNALVQDGLCGIRQLTRRDTFLTYEEMMNLVLWINLSGISSTTFYNLPVPALCKPVPLWTGKQLVSMMLPRIDLKGYHSTHSARLDEFKKRVPPPSKDELRTFELVNLWDTRVIIDDGDLLTGIICKRTAGSAAGSIVHVIWSDYGPDAARDFIDNASQVVVQWMLSRGFSVGLGDGILGRNAYRRISETVEEQHHKADIVLNMYRTKELVPQGNMTLEETKESKMQEILAKARDVAGALANADLPDFNNIKQMVEAGSKGSILNICQIAASVGQQIVEGKRIPYGFRDRTLPHFVRYDDTPQSRGFVRNSFVKGLQPYEVFFHAMGGREGLIDTAIRTSETGYIQRRLIKAFEDLTVRYDGTVRNSNNDILQFLYGEDGFDGTAIETQYLETVLLSDEEMRKRYYVDELQSTEWQELLSDREFLRKNLRLAEDRWPLPLNLRRLITRARKLFPNGQPPTHKQVYHRISDMRRALRPSKINMGLEGYNPSMLFCILLSSHLSSKQMVDIVKLSKEGFDWLTREIESRYKKGLIHAGEAVGIVAAQSIGEPATQMTLNVFHLSGTGNKAVTTGIPRLKELINAVKNIKTPGMTIYLLPEYRMDAMLARKIKANVEHCCLEDLLESSSIYYDPDYTNTTVAEDFGWLSLETSIPDPDAPRPEELYPWVLRLVLRREAMVERDLSIREVAQKVNNVFDAEIYVVHSDDNDDIQVLHLRLLKDAEEMENEAQENQSGEQVMSQNDFLLHIHADLLQSLTIKGVPGVDKAFISQKQFVEYDEDGNLVTKREFIIETDGINMRDVMKIRGIDPSRLYCNDPHEMLSLFGIEIARETLMEEIRNVIESGGSYINYRHLCLLCEVMTNRGQIMAITRHGMNKSDAGPLTKCSFEQTVDILTDAAIYGEKNEIRGVAESVIMGQIANIGTGMMDLLLDEDVLNRLPEFQQEWAVNKQEMRTDNDGHANDNDNDNDEYGMEDDMYADFFTAAPTMQEMDTMYMKSDVVERGGE